jgi:hypothetical protein
LKVRAQAIAALTAVLLAFVPAQAAAGDKRIPVKGYNGHVLIVPHDSPIRFDHFGGKYDPNEVHFRGHFILSGKFSYGCDIECNPPLRDEDLILTIEPDAAVAARLPHWENGGDMLIYISRERRLIDAITSSADRARLRSGKIANLDGRVTVIADKFVAAYECDHPVYTARFVSLVRAPARTRISGGLSGC